MEFLDEKNFPLDVQNSQEKFTLPGAGLLIKALTIFDELIDSPSKSSTGYSDRRKWCEIKNLSLKHRFCIVILHS